MSDLFEIGVRALEKGFLDRATLCAALADASLTPSIAPRQFWESRLRPEQLDALLLDAESQSMDGERASAPPPATMAGVAQHRFVRHGVLGIGGMGEVMEYEDRIIGRRVAIKRVKEGLANRERAFESLAREARITGKLQHPNIVPVYDAGTDPSGAPYYVMRLLLLPTLAQVLRNLKKKDPTTLAEFSLGKLVRSFIQVCNAIDFAHSRNVIHCDLKPSNILVGTFGEVLVVDWGFAHIVTELKRKRGGTPGFLAPEQLDSRIGPIDARSDVFALGAVLFDILFLQHAFPLTPIPVLLEMLNRGEEPIPPAELPRSRPPGRRVPPELEEICMQALRHDPAARFQTAGKLAEALEAFLEGTKEQERRQKRATELADQGAELGDSYRDMVESRPATLADLGAMRRRTPPWATAADKTPLWDAEDSLAVMDSVKNRTFQAAVSAFEHALDELKDHAAARQGLARLYWDELRRAEERRDHFERVYFEGHLAEIDGDAQVRPPSTGASLRVDGDMDTEAEISQLSEVSRRLLPSRRVIKGRLPLAVSELEPGSYLISAGRLRMPVVVRAAANETLTLPLRAAVGIAASEVLIPAGLALLGGHPSSVVGEALVEVHVPAFVIDTYPVRLGEYLAFAAERGPADAEVLPRNEDGTPGWEWREGRIVQTNAALRRYGAADVLSLPVFGVDVRCALLFAAWRSSRTGLFYRLPTELEWEKAARGVDGRAYPWGDQFDASFCKMRQSRPGRPAPEAPGAFQSDLSVYGVHDMAGGVAEWAVPMAETHPGGPDAVTRGGGWNDFQGDCSLASRRPRFSDERGGGIGFRLARTL